MSFPESQRVIYAKNTLTSVVCQLRFPPVLRIDASPPADFQDRVRDEYPLFEQKNGPELPKLPPDLAKLLLADISAQASMSYDFKAEDEKWTLGLTKDFLALTTTEYKQWEDFKKRFDSPLAALEEIYKPAFFSRVGLRYINVIRRSHLELNTIQWRELLKPPILGELAAAELQDRIARASRELIVELDDGAQVRIRHGLITVEDESAFLIDADYFTTKRTEVSDAISTLDRFNTESRRLFRWCIDDRLHDAMGPEPVQ